MPGATPGATPGAAPGEPSGAPPGWRLLGFLVSMMVLAMFNEALVSASAPRIVRDLHDFDRFSWIFIAYSLAMTTALPIIGRSADRVGPRTISLVGTAVFLLGSILCAISPTMVLLAGARFVQGLGAACLMAMAMTGVGRMFPRADQPRVQGLVQAAGNVALLLGPFVGGLLTDWISWRACFGLDIALAAGLGLWGLRHMRGEALATRQPFDVAGAVLFVASTIPFLYVLSTVGAAKAPAGRVELVAFVALCLPLLLWRELRVATPLLPVRMIARPTILLLLVSVAMHSACMYAAGVYFPLFAQAVGGASASRSALLFLPFPVAVIVTTFFAGRLASWLGIRGQLVVGSAIAAAGYFVLATRAVVAVTPDVLCGLALVGIGLGLPTPMFMVSVQGLVSREEIGTATTSVQLFRRLGSSIGVAALGALLLVGFRGAVQGQLSPAAWQRLEAADLLSRPQALLEPGGKKLHDAGVPAEAQAPIVAAVRGGLSSSLRTLFAVAAGLALLSALLLALTRPR